LQVGDDSSATTEVKPVRQLRGFGRDGTASPLALQCAVAYLLLSAKRWGLVTPLPPSLRPTDLKESQNINPALKYKRLHTEYACRKSIS
jgi:hypothetical protein